MMLDRFQGAQLRPGSDSLGTVPDQYPHPPPQRHPAPLPVPRNIALSPHCRVNVPLRGRRAGRYDGALSPSVDPHHLQGGLKACPLMSFRFSAGGLVLEI